MYMIKSSTASQRLPRLLASFKSNSPVILDIDEDFYGVMNGSDLLKDIDFDTIDRFNELLAATFTVRSVTGKS